MKYRAVVDKDNVVIAISIDNKQKGEYHKLGTWCDFTFRNFPEIPEDTLIFNNMSISKAPLLKVVDKALIVRPLEEIRAKYKAKTLEQIDVKVANYKLEKANEKIKEKIKPEAVLDKTEKLLTTLQEALATQIDTALERISAITLTTETIEADVQAIKDAVNLLTPETTLEELQTKVTELANELTILKNKI